MEARHPRIGFVDNDRFVLSVTGQLVQAAGMTISWAVPTADRALAASADPTRPIDVLVTDLQLEHETGLSLSRKIRLRDARLPIVILTAYSLTNHAFQARSAGAQALVGKDDFGTVIRVIRDVAQGKTYSPVPGVTFCSPQEANALLCRQKETGIASLSAAERKIAELSTSGETIAEIAATLGISDESVKTHLKRAYAKTGSKDRAELVAQWIRYSEGLV